MTDDEFNLEFNKKLLYYRENVLTTVYINIKAKISLAFAVTCTQCMHEVYICVIDSWVPYDAEVSRWIRKGWLATMAFILDQ